MSSRQQYPEWTRAHVRVMDHELDNLVLALCERPMAAPDWRSNIYPAADNDRFVQFIGVQNAINYAFTDPVSRRDNPTTGGKFAVHYAGELQKGSGGLNAAIMRACDSGTDLLDTSVLAGLSLAQAEHVFRSDLAPMTLVPERAQALNSLAASLEPFGGSFAEVLRQCAYDAEAVISLLVEQFPAYGTDRWLHPSSLERLVFDKRARLFAAIYEGRARSSGGALPTLKNLDAIGPVIDYQIPHALRAVRVLSYSHELAARVDSGCLIAPGSEEELAIRAVAHEVVAEILRRVVHMGVPTTMVELDAALWYAGRKTEGLHHLTLTTAY